MGAAEQLDYILLDPVYLFKHKKMPCDIYLKSNTRFFKRYKTGDQVTIAGIFEELGDNAKLYITADDYKELVSPQLPEFSEEVDEEQVHRISEKTFNSLANSLKNTPNEWSKQRVEKSVDWLKKIAKTNKGLAFHLKKLNSDELSYSYKKVQILYYLFMNSVSWIHSFSAEAMKVLTYMSFFCDLDLETDEEARVLTAEDLKAANLSAEEYKRVMQHALIASQTVAQIPGLPMGLTTFIMQHHGSKTGFGFPPDLSYNISPMAQIYIVYERFAWFLIEDFERIDLQFIANHMKEDFNKGIYAQAMKHLEKILNQMS